MDGRYRRCIPAGQRIFDVGDEGSEAYIIETGVVDILGVDVDDTRLIARLGADDMFGEMAPLGDGRRSARAVTVEDTTLFVIPRESFLQAVQSTGPLLRHLLRMNIQRVRRMSTGAPAESGDHSLADRDDRASAWERLRFEQELAAGLDRGEFLLHYQPIVALGVSGAPIVSLESLIRWQPEGRSRVAPTDFIPIAEASGQIVPIGHWIIDTACAAAAQLAGQGTPLTVAVNVSIRQLDDVDLVPCIEAALNRHSLPPERLRLELTESILIHNLEGTRSLLRRCQSLGLSLAMDDFGSGYSSLAYLHQLPFDTLKLDRSFCEEVLTRDATRKVVRAVAHLARDLGMRTVVEGIETAEQAQVMTELGIECGQGFHFHRPMDLEAVLPRLRSAENA